MPKSAGASMGVRPPAPGRTHATLAAVPHANGRHRYRRRICRRNATGGFASEWLGAIGCSGEQHGAGSETRGGCAITLNVKSLKHTSRDEKR